MAKEVVTNVVLVSSNSVSDAERDEVLSGTEFDTLEEYASSLETQVETLLAKRVFGDADDIPILSVDTYVSDAESVDYEEEIPE